MSSVGLRIKSDKLFFESRKEFERRIREIQADSTLKKDVKQTLKTQGFKSLLTFYDSFGEMELENLVATKDVIRNSNNNYLIVEELNEPTLVEAVDIEELQLLLNENRQVQVGEEIYTFNFYELIISDLEGNKIKVEKIDRKLGKAESKKPLKNGRGILTNFDDANFYSYNGKSYRIYIVLNYTSFTTNHFYAGNWSQRIYAKHQRKYLGVWINNNASIFLSGTALAGVYSYGNVCGTNWFETSKNAYCTYCGDMNFQYTDNAYPCYLDISANASFLCDDNNNRNVSVYAYSPW